MQLYHGSTDIIDKPVFGGGNPHNDYGLGLYCTRDLDLAKEWGCRTPQGGFANEYEIDEKGLAILDLSSDEWHILNWMAILLENRLFDIGNPLAKEAKDYIIETFMPSYKDKDIIIGYRADDSYFSFAKAFLNGTITLDALSRAMNLGKLGQQYCIKSERAFLRLRYIRSVIADGQEYYVRRTIRDLTAREDYMKLLSEEKNSAKGIYMIDILRQQWRNDDERLR